MKKLTFFIFFFSFSTSFLVAQTVSFITNQMCYGQMTTLKGSSTLPDSSIVSWSWDFGDNTSSTGKMVFHLFTEADTFSVKLQIVTTTSKDSVTQDVIVHPLPDVNFHVDNLCEGKSATYFNESTVKGDTITQYLWDFNNDGIVDNNTGPIVQYTCGPAQKYQTKLECVTNKGCRAFATKTTEVFNQPVAKFSVDNTCFGDSTIFINQSTLKNETMSFYLWNFGDGNQGVNFPSPKHFYNASGNYTDSLIAISPNNCKDTAVLNVTVKPLPNISLSVGDTILYEGNTTTITADGVAASYLWSTNATTQNITVNQGGIYSITATGANSCKVTKFATITMKSVKEKDVTIEDNVMTPNGDGINDDLKIADLGAYKNCELTIYNVWNDVVFSNLDYKNDWNGITKDGKPLDAGTYFYIIKCADHQQTAGSINILR